MFTSSQQDLLKSVGRSPSHPDFGTPNPQLDEVILKLRKNNPQAFLRFADLQERVFVNKPVSNIPLKGYLYPLWEAK
jgi:hypothetical protein